jgi:alkylation response protein AidB-like acyl-CoA dehydrogenase
MGTTMVAPVMAKRVVGGAFLIEDLGPNDIFTPEDFSPEQKQIADVAVAFSENEVLANAAAIEGKDWSMNRKLMKKAGELGLLGIDVPEEYGGLEMDKITSTLVADYISTLGSFSVTFGAHSNIGTMPLVWYGTPDQKAKYLPKIAAGDWVAAYALSEASAGSDAMNIRTQAVLSADGSTYTLNGEKMWISNAGFADIFTVFAKTDGKISAFLVERGTPGFTVGPEEHKMGIRGSSTCPLIFEDCKIPAENLLGEAGKGHHIAFNILNVGRYKLAAAVQGGARKAFRDGVRYANDRVAFGKPISSFGLVQEKIARCAADLYAGESLLYRTVGAIEASLSTLDKSSPNFSKDVQKAIEDFAVECSILKVWGSDMTNRVCDDMLQIHGGYGYVEEFAAERSFRDARINKIFEGTNEINRLIITGWMIKRAMQGKLALIPAIQKLMDEVMAGPGARMEIEGELGGEKLLLANAKKIGLFCSGAASQKYGDDMGNQQEVMGALADILAEVLVLESMILRTEKMAGKSETAIALTKYYAARSFALVESSAERVIAAVAEGDMLKMQMTIFRRLTKREPVNSIALGRKIAERMIEAGRYVV